MRIDGHFHKNEGSNLIAIEIPCLAIWTQSRGKKNALSMAKAAVVDLLDTKFAPKKFSRLVSLFEGNENQFTLSVPEETVALVISQLRLSSELSFSDVIKTIGFKSKNSIAQYERGDREPSLAVFDRILQAMDYELVVSVRKKVS